MESLYRKYRPLTFESVVGQQHIVSTLEHAVAEGRLSHAYLFCGPRGTGKTTMARILAKSLLCQGADAARAAGGSGCMPDGTCPECEAIAAGTHPDVYELDAASRTGVDNVREEIINSVNFAPVRGAYKVYIIDEVHMLTTAAFNALLKTLEEPPAHVVFVLCTTDPQKLLETILSRCQRFDFHRISNEDIVGRLRQVCEQEGFACDEEALEIVAKHARGGMRDALSTLEQLSVFGGGSVRVSDARSLLGEVGTAVLAEFACKIAVRDTVGLFSLVRDQLDKGNDLLELTRDLVAHMRDVYTASIAGPRVELFDGTPEEVEALAQEASMFETADRLARALTVLDDAALEMRNASDPRLVLEIALTRLARPETDLTLEALAERIAHLETQMARGIQHGPMDAGKLAGAASASAAVSSSAASRPTPVPVGAPSATALRPATAPAVPKAASVVSAAPRPAAPVPAPAKPESAPVQDQAPVAPSPSAPVVPSPAASQPAPTPVVPKAASDPAQSAPAAAPAPAAALAQPAPAPTSAPAASTPVKPQVSATVSAEAQSTMAACAVTPPAADEGDLQRRWLEAVKLVTAAQPSRGGLLQSSRAVSDDGETLTVAFPKGSAFALKMISRADSHELVMPVICQVFGKRSVTYVMEGPAPSTSASAPAPAPAASTSVPAPAPKPVAPPTPKPQPAAAPALASTSASATPAAPASKPAVQPTPPAAPIVPAPAQPAPTASRPTPAPQVDQASGPTVVPEPNIAADRQAWADDQPPYDDAFIASYEDDLEVPPFDPPAFAPPVSAAPAPKPTPAPAPVSAAPAPPKPTPVSTPAAAPAPQPASAPAAPAPRPAPAPVSGQDEPADVMSTEDAQALLNGIWGNVVIKPVE